VPGQLILEVQGNYRRAIWFGSFGSCSGRILFGSEMIGAVRGIDSQTDHHFDNTRRYIDALGLTPAARASVDELNARRIYPRLGALIKEPAVAERCEPHWPGR